MDRKQSKDCKPSKDRKKSGPSLVEGGALHLVRLGMPCLQNNIHFKILKIAPTGLLMN